jgi:hypothetical protein
MKILFINISLLFVFSIQTNNITYIKEKEFDGYIFGKDHFVLISVENQKERYTPTKEDIIKAEKLIKRDLRKANKSLMNQGESCPIIHENLKCYTRQYFGFVNQQGEKIIWINFVWKTKSIEAILSKDLFNVLDGCSHYWNINVNLGKGKLFNLNINGQG